MRRKRKDTSTRQEPDWSSGFCLHALNGKWVRAPIRDSGSIGQQIAQVEKKKRKLK